VEYPALQSTVDCGGVVGFILRLKPQVFSSNFYNTGGKYTNPALIAMNADPHTAASTKNKARVRY